MSSTMRQKMLISVMLPEEVVSVLNSKGTHKFLNGLFNVVADRSQITKPGMYCCEHEDVFLQAVESSEYLELQVTKLKVLDVLKVRHENPWIQIHIGRDIDMDEEDCAEYMRTESMKINGNKMIIANNNGYYFAEYV